MLIENIFDSLFHSTNFFRVVYPHIEGKYFPEKVEEHIFNKIKKYNLDFGKQPKVNDIKLLVESDNTISEKDSEEIYEYLTQLKDVEKVTDEKLLIKQTEEFIQNRALELAIYDSVSILQDTTKSKGLIEDTIRKALAVEFEVKLGHDFFEDAKDRMDSYLLDEDKILLDVELINMAMGGGLVRKSLFILMANTNVGKCCKGNTKITVKNKKTGLVEEIEIQEFYNKIK